MLSTNTIILRLFLSMILSGVIGVERESINRPAGIRTHMLVGVGSTLVVLTSSYIYFNVSENIQLDRMAAQVISGIGFLGAGTIMKEGKNIKGLTTAAGLWASACIGIALGTGFILGAVITTAIVLFTLIVLGRMEAFTRDNSVFELIVHLEDIDSNLNIFSNKLGQDGVDIESIERISTIDGVTIIKFRLKRTEGIVGKTDIGLVLRNLKKLPGVKKMEEKK